MMYENKTVRTKNWLNFRAHPKLIDRAAFLNFGFFLLLGVTLNESVYATFCVNDLLLTSVEGVAAAADFNTDCLLGRTQLNFTAANAGRYDLVILRMNAFFHDRTSIDYILGTNSSS